MIEKMTQRPRDVAPRINEDIRDSESAHDAKALVKHYVLQEHVYTTDW